MDIRKLRYFVAVAEELSFVRAAQRLSISQPPLSTQIKELEAELGVMLLKRSRRSVELTEAGFSFLEKARLLLEHLDAAIFSTRRIAAGGPKSVRFGIVGSALFSILPQASDFIKRTLSNVEISFLELGSAEQVVALSRDVIDIGIVHSPVSIPDGRSRDISDEPYAIVVPETHVLAEECTVDLLNFSNEHFITFSRDLSPSLFDSVIVACKQSGFSPKINHTARHVLMILQLVRMGMGVALVPSTMRKCGYDGIRFLNIREQIPSVKLSVIWRNTAPSHIEDLAQSLPFFSATRTSLFLNKENNR